MFTIDAAYVPIFYTVFALIMLALIVWSVRRMFLFNYKMNKIHQSLATNKRMASGKLPPLNKWSTSAFYHIKLSDYERIRSSILFVEKTRIQLTIQHQHQAFLHFYLYFEYRLFQAPQGSVTLKNTDDEINLQFYYKNGEESVNVIVNNKKLGHITLDVKALPLPLADALLYDVNNQLIGKWDCRLKPQEEVKLGDIRYGNIILHGNNIAKMLAYNPKRIGKSRWQLAFDLLNLQIYPDSPHFHYHRGAPYFKEVNENITSEQAHWLLALTALLLYKETWQPQGKRRV